MTDFSSRTPIRSAGHGVPSLFICRGFLHPPDADREIPSDGATGQEEHETSQTWSLQSSSFLASPDVGAGSGIIPCHGGTSRSPHSRAPKAVAG